LLALDKRLAAIQAHPHDFLTDLALKCFTPSARPTPIADRLDLTPDPTLNPEQFAALMQALTHDFLYLWGPPGTGKTQVIGAITRLAMQRGDRVLICSNTNMAVDEALEAVLKQSPKHTPGDIVRYGLVADDAPPSLAPVTLDRLSSDEMHRLTEQLATLQRQAAPIEEELKTFTAITALQEQIQTTYAQLNSLHEQLAVLQTALARTEQRYAAYDREVLHYDTELQHFWTASRWRRLFLRHHTDIQADLLNAQLLRHDATESLERLRTQHATVHERLRNTVAIHRQLHQSLFTQLGPDDLDTLSYRLSERQQQANQLHHDITALQYAISTLERRLIQQARVLATTITRTYTAAVLEQERFDLVIIDEGSMATPPALFTALCLARKQVLIVGDFFQLSPIAESRTAQAKQWLSTDIYTLTGIANDHDPRVAALTTQYRMHPDIAALAARLYQRAGLSYRTDTQIRAARQPIVEQAPIPGKALAFVDTSDAQPWVEKDHKGSPCNRYHATLAVALATQALQDSSTLPPRICIITPYRHQVRLLHDLVSQANLGDRIHVGTIHSVQGQQHDVVIFDSTVTGDLTKTMLGRCDHDRNPSKLLNVAFTRSKSKLIIIGHRPSITTLLHTPDNLLGHALQATISQDSCIPSARILTPALTHVSAPTPEPPTPTDPTPPDRSAAQRNRLYLIRRRSATPS
jgi:superfamily I DNA and/or RNA helicase